MSVFKSLPVILMHAKFKRHWLVQPLKKNTGGCPRGLVVKFVCSASVAWVALGGSDLHHLAAAMWWQHPA